MAKTGPFEIRPPKSPDFKFSGAPDIQLVNNFVSVIQMPI